MKGYRGGEVKGQIEKPVVSDPRGGFTPSDYALGDLINERAFNEHVRRIAILGGWLYYHTFDARRSTPGFPDIVLVRRGSIIFAELKDRKGKTTKEQDQWLKALEATGKVESYLWRPADFPEIAKRLLVDKR